MGFCSPPVQSFQLIANGEIKNIVFDEELLLMIAFVVEFRFTWPCPQFWL